MGRSAPWHMPRTAARSDRRANVPGLNSYADLTSAPVTGLTSGRNRL